jgi:uncharacterized protein YjbI with pentapeptide repeats
VRGACRGDPTCTGATLFNANASSSYEFLSNDLHTQRYAANPAVTGALVTETVSVGGAQAKMIMGVVNGTEGRNPAAVEYDGVLGLNAGGFLSDATLKEKVVGIYLKRANASDAAAGEITLGGINQALLDGPADTHAVPKETNIDREDLWILDAVRPTLDGKDTSPPAKAILDTLSPVIVGPTPAVKAWYEALGPAIEVKHAGGIYYYKQPAAGTIKAGLRVGAKDYPIDDADLCLTALTGKDLEETQLVNVDANSVWCQGAVQSAQVWGESQSLSTAPSDSDPWTLGYPFLRNVYTVLHLDEPRSVGFGRLKEGGAANGTAAADPNSGAAASFVQPAMVVAAAGLAVALF